jgi:hypothetical protein
MRPYVVVLPAGLTLETIAIPIAAFAIVVLVALSLEAAPKSQKRKSLRTKAIIRFFVARFRVRKPKISG